jgi:hypothetical protein
MAKGGRRKTPATGLGWGGPAKGAGNGKPRYVFGKPGPGRGHFSIAGENRMEREARIAEEMRELLYGFATDDGRQDLIRLQASDKLLNRIEGLPVQKVVQQQQDALSRMTDEELEAYAEQQRARIASYDEARAKESDPK